MLSLSYFERFALVCPERLAVMGQVMGEEASAEGFLKALAKLQKACGVDSLKMSDYGITEGELTALAENAHSAMGGLYDMDRKRLAVEDTRKIMEKAFR